MALLAGVLLGGCRADVPAEAEAWPVEVTSVAALDAYADRDALVSITGRVVQQDEDGRRLVLADASGYVEVRLPSAQPVLDEDVVSVLGVVRRERGGLTVQALEWAYDPALRARPLPPR